MKTVEISRSRSELPVLPELPCSDLREVHSDRRPLRVPRPLAAPAKMALLPRPIHHAGSPETDETKRDEASRSLALARSLHLFQRLASCLTYEGPHERQGERGGHGVKPVGTGETDRIQQWQEGDGDGEVRHPVGGAGHRQRRATHPVGKHLTEEHPHY